ncbi:MAG: hypothetical protein FWC16_12180 [Defluviitaleaceae bacterium]|nr:hypothetical protein [Defluviitaleaceae bacterium]MCL2275677.1 hypothetical protein [Defluviitaleaceae bacterium]
MREKLVLVKTEKGRFSFLTRLYIVMGVSFLFPALRFNVTTDNLLVLRFLLLFVFVFAGFYLLGRGIRTHLILTADENGINDFQGFSVGNIAWQDIVNIQHRTYTKYGMSTEIIDLILVDEDVYLQRLSFWARWLLKSNKRDGFSATMFDITGAREAPEVILLTLQALHEKYTLAKGAETF